MQNYQHPNIPELFARIDKDGSHSVFLRGEKALEEVSKEDLKHMGFHIEEDRSHNIVMPIGTAGEDIKTGQCVQVCDRGIVMKYRHGKQVEQEEKRDRIDNLYKEFFECFKQVYIMGNREYIGTCKESEDGMQKKFVELVEKHMPKRLCRIIKRGDLQGKEFDYIIIDENVTEEQIKEMQQGMGKEKEERERDRIDDLIDDIENGLDVDIRLLIESHIPKKKKFTEIEVKQWFWDRYGSYPVHIFSFLKYHGQLEK